jgi:hypothetical protein
MQYQIPDSKKKIKINLSFIKIKILCSEKLLRESKDIHEKEKKITKHRSDKGFVSKICKDFSKHNW